MSLAEMVVRLFAPHVCVGCGVEEDRLLCAGCADALPRVPSRCYRCGAVSANYAVCRSCAPNTPLCQVLVLTYHQGSAKELVHRMKYERARAGAVEAATLMSEVLQYMPGGSDIVVTHVPTATSRVRQRGYDHARLIACRLSGDTQQAALLVRVGQAHLVGSNRSKRLRQLEGAFRPVHTELIRDRHVVLVDDVLTTGVTLETAARVLKRAGARRVSAAVFAQA